MHSSAVVDAVVVGAGTSGSACALALACAGKRVYLLEQGPLDNAGARWVNGVPQWMYDAASLDRPLEPELRHHGRFFVQGAVGGKRVCISSPPASPIDVRHLTQRLHGLCRQAGVTLLPHCQIHDVHIDARGRLRALSGRTQDGPVELRAQLFVDASGLKATLRKRHPNLSADTPRVERHDLCSAAQAVFELRDRDAARAYLAQHDLRPGDTLCTLGTHGGFSTANLTVDPDWLEHEATSVGEAEILTGAIADGQYLSGPRIIDEIVTRHPFIGQRKFGGAGAIPLRRPYDRLGRGGLALVGNAACQVFPAHGSGTGIGLIAGRLLARRVCAHPDLGSEAALWDYQSSFHRQYSGTLAFYDLVRRHSQSISAQAISELIDAGLPAKSSQIAALDQRLPNPSARELVQVAAALLKARGRAFAFARALAPAPAVVAHYARFPRRISESKLAAWSRRGAWIRGDAADLAQLADPA